MLGCRFPQVNCGEGVLGAIFSLRVACLGQNSGRQSVGVCSATELRRRGLRAGAPVTWAKPVLFPTTSGKPRPFRRPKRERQPGAAAQEGAGSRGAAATSTPWAAVRRLPAWAAAASSDAPASAFRAHAQAFRNPSRPPKRQQPDWGPKAPSTVAKTRNLGQFKGAQRENHITIVQGATAKRTSLLVARRAPAHFSERMSCGSGDQLRSFSRFYCSPGPQTASFRIA